MIDFAEPRWLIAGALACAALALLMLRGERRRRAATRALAAASPATSVARGRRWLRHGLALVGLAMVFVALARPRAGYSWQETPHRGIDLVFAVDTSKSMLAADVRPDRLTRARLAVADLVAQFEGERVGLVAFAGGAFVQAPLTADHRMFLETLEAVDTDVIPRGGSDLSAAIRAGAQAMATEPGRRKLMILLSDGEDLAGNAVEAARAAAAEGVTIHTIGIGSARGELIQVPGPDGAPALVRDARGEPVRSKLDEPTLRAVAEVTGGAYQPLGADGRGLARLYERELAGLPRDATTSRRKVYDERYQVPLAIALGCLLVELVLGERRRRRGLPARAAAVAAVGLVVAGFPAIASAGAASAVAEYNAGTATYRQQDFAAAEEQFARALRTDDVGLQVDAYYNLGNARYRVGEAALERDRERTIASWTRALEAYDAALALAPEDEDARFNRDLVARKLAALQEEDQQQQQDQQQQGDQPEDPQQQGGDQPKDPQQQGDDQPKDPQQQGGDEPEDPQQQGGDQPKDQPGDQGQPKDQPGDQGQQPEDPQGNQGQPKDQQGHQGPQPSQQPSAPEPGDDGDRRGAGRAGGDEPSDDAADAARADAARRAAGELTRGEAIHLLDAVEDELRPMPIEGTAPPADDAPIQDW